MSLPNDWKLHSSELTKHARDGRDATYNGLKELIERGYCKRNEVRDSKGLFAGYEYIISDVKEFAPQTANPHTENPFTDNPHTENPSLLNTNNIQNDSLTDITNGPTIEIVASPVKPVNEESQDLFGEAPTKVKKGTREQLCLFANSKFADFPIFVKEFQLPEFENIDLAYYYHAIADWSASGGKKKHDWIATTRNWMRADKEKGKLHTLNVISATESADMVQYLQDMSE